MSLQKRLTLIFISSSLIAGILFLQMGLYLLHHFLGLRIGFNIILFCELKLRSLGFSIDFFLDALVLYTLFFAVWKFLWQITKSNGLYKKLLTVQHEAWTAELNSRHSRENRYSSESRKRQDYLVTQHASPFAVTLGFFKPKIILSTGLINLLEDEELEAVLHHEQHHQVHKDPLKNFLLYLMASVMWYIPLLKWLQHQHKILTEVTADHYAVDRLGSSFNLGNALIKLLKNGHAEPMSFSYVSFADTSINYRIQKLIDPETEFPLKLPKAVSLFSLLAVLLLCALFVVVGV